MPRERLASKAQIIEYYVHGEMNQAETAAALGITQVTLIRYMRHYGIPGRAKGGVRRADQEAVNKRRQEILALHRAGWSALQIAEKYRISRQRVYIIIKKEAQ